MKVLLRSCIQVNPTDDIHQLFDNFTSLKATNLSFDTEEDRTIWSLLGEFVSSYTHVPTINTLKHHLTAVGNDDAIKRLEYLALLPPVFRGDYHTRLRDLVEQHRQQAFNVLLRDAADIGTMGKEFREGRETRKLKGPQDAIRYLLDRSHEIVAPVTGIKLSGEVTRDGRDFTTQYQLRAENPMYGMGQHTGIEQIDKTLNGAKVQELWVHAAFTGGLKSTFMLNWAYNQAVWFGWSSAIFSLEMPYYQCRNLLYAMHSGHGKFSMIRQALGLQTDANASATSLPYEAIRDGQLREYHPNAERFLLEYVVPDFNGERVGDLDPVGAPWLPPETYGKIHIEVANPDKSDFTIADLRQRAELIHSQSPFKTLFIDHAGLMSPRKWVGDTTERLNEVIRDAKKLAMSFNRGQGMAVVALFQLSREGFKSAQKAKEKGGKALYNLTHLAYANECERSSDIVTTTYIDEELSKINRVQFQCLKSRDQKPFAPFNARIEWANRRLLTCDEITDPGDETALQIQNLKDFTL